MGYYDYLFNRIPAQLFTGIGNGCILGDKAYEQITNSDSNLFRSKYMYGLRSRIHDKAIQLYLSDRLGKITSIQLFGNNVGFGNRVLLISGDGFSINPCHVSAIGSLPTIAKYKLKASQSNPGDTDAQMNLFKPPISQDYKHVYFLIALYFDGMRTIPVMLIPNNDFTTILSSRPILSTVDSNDEEIAYQERAMPKLISEVEESEK